jgi:hypothetical protein
MKDNEDICISDHYVYGSNEMSRELYLSHNSVLLTVNVEMAAFTTMLNKTSVFHVTVHIT